MGDVIERIEKVMSEAVGSPVTHRDLDVDKCADFTLYELATRIADLRETVRVQAETIIKDMQRVLDGAAPTTLSSTSSSSSYDTAVAALDALARPLGIAARFYRTEHDLGE